MPVSIRRQMVAQQHAVDGAAGQLHLLPRQQDLELARSPIGINLAHLDHALLQLRPGSRGTLLRTPAAFCDPGQTRFLIALPPETSRGTRDVPNSWNKAVSASVCLCA